MNTCAVAALFVLIPAAWAQTGTGSHQPVARTGDQVIYEEDLLPTIGGQIFQLRRQEYDLKVRAITNLIDQRLLEAEASRRGLSVESLWQQVDQSLPPWQIGELEGFYLAQKDRFNQPLAEIRPRVEQAFLEAKRQEARQNHLAELRQKAGIVILLSEPAVQVSADPSRLRGAPGSPITIVEFADFQCPYCLEAERTLKEVLGKYEGKVQLSFRDFPLRSIHPQAQSAAEAARCAGEQGKFWEYHDLLYGNQGRLDPAGLLDDARTAGLNLDLFQACLASAKHRASIENDLQLGAASGVTGTPAFYINGTPLIGAQPVSAFEKIIDSKLACGAADSRCAGSSTGP